MIYIKNSLFFFGTFLTIVASSCSRLEEAMPIAPYADQVLENASKDALDTKTFEPINWIDENWWQLFNDPQLTAFIEQALADNPRIRIADAKVWIAGAEAKGEAAALYPHLGLDVESIRVHVSKTGIFENAPPTLFPFNYTQTGLLFAFSYEFDWWGKNRNSLAAAIGEVQASSAESATARLAIALSVAESYLQYQTDLELTKNVELQLRNQQQQYELMQQRVKSNIDTNINLQKYARFVFQVTDKLLAVKQHSETVKHRIQALVAGDFQDVINERQSAPLEAPFPLPAYMPLDLISHRPDIMAQIWRVYAMAREVDVAKALFYPDINLKALLGWQTIHIGKLFDSASRAALWGAALHLPLFQGGALTANLEGRKLAYCAAVSEYENLILHAVKEILDAIKNLEYLNERMEAAKAVVKSSSQTYELIDERFKHNLSSQFDLLKAEAEWLYSKESEIKLQGLIELAMLALIKALGGGFGAC